MAENSKIEWCDHTLNFWIGCQEVSPACDHCYARVQNNFRGWVKGWGPHGERKRTKTWSSAMRWNRAAERVGVNARVFSNSLSDFFDNKADPMWRRAAWEIIGKTPWLQWLILTKRPENIVGMLPFDWLDGYHNVMLGTTVENQEEATRRVGKLLDVPAAGHFLSCEPLLGEVDLCGGWSYLTRTAGNSYKALDWVICGGESGAGRRPMDLSWARKMRDQCRERGVPFFMKQIDKKQPIPDDLMIREFPRAA